jgi:putative Holliday junction resolvase
LDLGDVRIGLAISDELGLTAQPAGVYTRRSARADLDALATLVAERDIRAIVVGLPLLLSGEPGARAQAAQAFAEHLRGRLPDMPVELWDERLTTAEAQRTLIAADVSRRRRREVVDSMAAVLILQGYLDRQPQAQAER